MPPKIKGLQPYFAVILMASLIAFVFFVGDRYLSLMLGMVAFGLAKNILKEKKFSPYPCKLGFRPLVEKNGLVLRSSIEYGCFYI